MRKRGKVNCVLLIDDNEIDNFINENILRSAGFSDHIIVYKSGQSALEFLKNIEKNYDFMSEMLPELIFLDLNMPLMNGYQFLSEFEKLDERIKSRIKVVVLTSSHDPSDLKQSGQIPRVKHFMQKPLNEKDIFRLSA